MKAANDWRSKVYYQEIETMEENWNEIREAILIRDNRRCLRCDKIFKKSNLSVHHIIPRDEGGVTAPSNLVTLCHPCHDIVEIDQLKTKASIIGSYETEVPIKKTEKNKTIKHKDESFERPAWHSKVYGGVK